MNVRQETEPATRAGVAVPGGQHQSSNAADITPPVRPAQLRPNTKKWSVLQTLLGRSLNRFEAEHVVHDHCLHSTVSGLERHGLRIDRHDEVVPGFNGHPTHVTRYHQIAEDQRELAQRLLGIG